jgi:hypothetical protein
VFVSAQPVRLSTSTIVLIADAQTVRLSTSAIVLIADVG